MPLDETIITAYLCLWLGISGAVWGSFADCAVSRWAAGEQMFAGRSRCASCKHTLRAIDLVPVFSWLFRRGRCGYCGEKIPADCLAAELAGAAGFVCIGLRLGPVPELGQWLIWAGLLLCLSLTDAAKRIIPDKLLLALTVNRAVWLLALGQDLRREGAVILLACAVPAALLVLILLAEKAVGRELMGGGDIKLLFALALYLSWAQLLLTLLTGCLIGLVWAAATGGGRKDALAFGPFLAVGTMVTVCLGGPLLEWYFRLF